MKNLLLIIVLTTMSFVTVSANADTRLSFAVVLPEYANIDTEASTQLSNKLQSVVSNFGYSDSKESRFILTAKIDVFDRKINSSGFIINRMNVTFIVGDVIEDKIFATQTLNLLGVGETETKSFIKAFQSIKSNNSKLELLLNESTERIRTYYINSFSDMLQKVDRMVAMKDFDSALSELALIPPITSEIFSTVQDKLISVFNAKTKFILEEQQNKIDEEALLLIQQAKSKWMTQNTYSNAADALALLAKVHPKSSCIHDAENLMLTINNQLRSAERVAAEAAAAKAKAEWEFKMRQYEDDLQMAKDKEANNSQILNTLVGRFGKLDLNIQKQKATKWGLGN